MEKERKEKLVSVAGKGKGLLGEFKSFVLRGNVMDMAIGVIIGGAFSNIVTALTKDFINPIINCLGGAEIKGQTEIFNTGQYILWGDFLTAVINFVIMAFVLFIMLKSVNSLVERTKKKEEAKEEAKKAEDILLLEEIRDLLKKQNKK